MRSDVSRDLKPITQLVVGATEFDAVLNVAVALGFAVRGLGAIGFGSPWFPPLVEWAA